MKSHSDVDTKKKAQVVQSSAQFTEEIKSEYNDDEIITVKSPKKVT